MIALAGQGKMQAVTGCTMQPDYILLARAQYIAYQWCGSHCKVEVHAHQSRQCSHKGEG